MYRESTSGFDFNLNDNLDPNSIWTDFQIAVQTDAIVDALQTVYATKSSVYISPAGNDLESRITVSLYGDSKTESVKSEVLAVIAEAANLNPECVHYGHAAHRYVLAKYEIDEALLENGSPHLGKTYSVLQGYFRGLELGIAKAETKNKRTVIETDWVKPAKDEKPPAFRKRDVRWRLILTLDLDAAFLTFDADFEFQFKDFGIANWDNKIYDLDGFYFQLSSLPNDEGDDGKNEREESQQAAFKEKKREILDLRSKTIEHELYGLLRKK